MKKLFCWALAMVALNVLVYQVCMVVWGHDWAVAFAPFAAITTFAFAATILVVVVKEENLPHWRVMALVLGEIGAILGWMLLEPHSLPLAVASLAVGVGVMALGSLRVCFAAAVGQ